MTTRFSSIFIRTRRFAGNPMQVCGQSAAYWDSNDFREFVGVHGLYQALHRRIMLRNRFNKDRHFDPAFHFALPAVDGSTLALYVDARGQPLFHQLVRKRGCLCFVGKAGNDKYVLRLGLWVGLGRLGHLFASIENGLILPVLQSIPPRAGTPRPWDSAGVRATPA